MNKLIEVSTFIHNIEGENIIEKNDFSVVKIYNHFLVKDDFDKIQESLEDINIKDLKPDTAYNFTFKIKDHYEGRYVVGYYFELKSHEEIKEDLTKILIDNIF